MLRRLCRGGSLALLAATLTGQAFAQTAPPSDPIGFRGGDTQFPDLIAPGDASGPFTEVFWTRGDAGSGFAAWENFASATGLNAPGIRETIGQIPIPGGFLDFVQGIPGTPLPLLPREGDASVRFLPVLDPPIVTSTRNLYSGGGPGRVELVSDAEDLGVGFDTRVVLQIGSLGSLQDLQSFSLEYVGADGEEVELPPIFAGQLAELGDSGSAMGGISEQSFAVWNIPGFNPEDFTLSYSVPGNLSSSTLILDVLTEPAGPVVAGDFSGNGVVNETDLEVFLNQFGTSSLNADGNGDGIVDAADYTVWRDALAATLATPDAAAVPEPTGAHTLALLTTIAFCAGSHTLTQTRKPR